MQAIPILHNRIYDFLNAGMAAMLLQLTFCHELRIG
jgi:hypothetical protein